MRITYLLLFLLFLVIIIFTLRFNFIKLNKQKNLVEQVSKLFNKNYKYKEIALSKELKLRKDENNNIDNKNAFIAINGVDINKLQDLLHDKKNMEISKYFAKQFDCDYFYIENSSSALNFGAENNCKYLLYFLKSEDFKKYNKIILLGHCNGVAALIKLICEIKNKEIIKKLVLIFSSGYDIFEHIICLDQFSKYKFKFKIVKEININFKDPIDFLKDKKDFSLEVLNIPIFHFHCINDKIINFKSFKNYKNVFEDRQFKFYETLELNSELHFLTRTKEDVKEKINNFLEKYINL